MVQDAPDFLPADAVVVKPYTPLAGHALGPVLAAQHPPAVPSVAPTDPPGVVAQTPAAGDPQVRKTVGNWWAQSVEATMI